MSKRELTKFFKQNGLTKDQISYAHTLKQMYGSTHLDKIIELAKQYQSMV